MSIEDTIFIRKYPEEKKLIQYGFYQEGNVYYYSKMITEHMLASIQIIDGKVEGKVIDQEFEEEYINFRLEGKLGEYASMIKYHYIDLLEDICKQCFIEQYFIFDQANRITQLIENLYNHKPDFIFETAPTYGVFRHANSKWYGLIMNIDGKKVDEKLEGEIEILNVKVKEELLPSLLEMNGIYPSYHMSKKSWVSVLLNDTLEDAFIFNLIQQSYEAVDDHLNYHEWIVPGSAKLFDIENMFEYQDTHLWKQSTNVHIGDLVYIYASQPFSCILFQCEVLQVDIPYRFKSNLEIQYVMKLRHLKSYEFGAFSLNELKKYGVTTIRGPRHIPDDLSQALHQYETR